MSNRKQGSPQKIDNDPPVVESLPQELIRVGKDEMNLVEHPFATLWKNEDKDTEIYLQWERPHPTSGKPVKASWRVTGDPELGLPTAADERVYLALMELTREAGFTHTVYFTRYDILSRLGWPDNRQSYQMLKNAFVRLTSVNITAENSFWNPRAKQFSSAGFHILENYEIFAEPPGRKSKSAALPFSYFKWNDVLFQSFVNGNIRTLDLTLAFALKGSIALRLFRFLDKKTYGGRHSFQIDLRELCELHLGMAVENCYESNLKAKLKPAHDELIKIGVLKGARYEPMKTKKGSKVCYTFPSSKALTAPEESASELPQDQPQPAPDLLQRMLDLKVSRDVAEELLKATPAEQLAMQLDCLADRAPKDAAATFVKAVREGWEPPARFFERLEAAEQAQKAKEAAQAQAAQKAAQEAAEREQRAAQEQEAAALDAIWEKLDARTRERLDGQVRQRLEANEFLRARLEAGKLTPQSPDWIKTRYIVLQEMLGHAVAVRHEPRPAAPEDEEP